MTLPIKGKLLTSEQSYRLAMMDSVPREDLIAAIAAHLRRAERSACYFKLAVTPQQWYSTTFQRARK